MHRREGEASAADASSLGREIGSILKAAASRDIFKAT
jgi:hypothetical protein